MRCAARVIFAVGVTLIVTPNATWAATTGNPPVAAAESPGADFPLRGQSLFDVLRAELSPSSAQPVPFPLRALLAQLRARYATANGAAPYAAVLIPLGRSLQRHAAAPDYFRYPRVVVAMIGESGATDAPVLKDRLYFAYQEQARVLEVISYNEAMGRFEFQVVKDYRAGGSARVYYAKRAICTACHQNHAPIFARPLWGETNANPAVAARLAAQQRDFYGLPVSVSIDVPNAIDDAVQRANRFGFAQTVWRKGCAAHASGAGCRASLLNAALQLRLSGGLGYAANDPDWVLLRAAWQRHWPQGLAVANPDIPNRDPLNEINTATAREVAVPAALDPLLPRPPLEVLRFDQVGTQDEIVAQLAAFFSASDIAALDQALVARGRPASKQTTTATCQFTRNTARLGAWRLDVHCETAAASPLAIEGRLYFVGQRLQRAVFDRLALASDALDNISVPVTPRITLNATGIALPLLRDGLQVRRHSGNALPRIVLQWSAGAEQQMSFIGSATLEERLDSVPLRAAVQRLADHAASAADQPLSGIPLQRARILPALFAQLGKSAPNNCCADASRALPPQMEPVATLDLTRPTATAAASAAAMQSLQRYCAPCHDSAERFPPNFLSGDFATVQAQLRHCAARIDYRLSMWTLPAVQRGKTPMPPELALRADQRDPRQWAASHEYRQLRQFINSLRSTSSVATSDYTQLDSCLPEENK